MISLGIFRAGEGANQVRCPICECKFWVFRHNTTGDYEYTCDDCGFRAISKREWDQQRLDHFGEHEHE